MPARLTVEAGTAQPPVVDLHRERAVSLGRNRGSTIVLHDEHASRFHAEVFPSDDGWFIRDCGATNGTRVNGERIRRETPLADGHQIAIGDVRLRFHADPDKNGTAEFPVLDPDPPSADLHATVLEPDAMTALLDFAMAAAGETSPHDLVHRALALLRSQTRAAVCGFLSVDPEEPLAKVVVPDDAQVDTHLSARLNEKALSEGRAVWTAAPGGSGTGSESLAGYQDALCVPLRRVRVAGSPPVPPEPPLGALHVYKANRRFSEREIRFCEALAAHLANGLHGLRSRRALEADNSRLRVFSPRGADELVGGGPVLTALRAEAKRLALCPAVHVRGESGVGKELVALALHRHGPRSRGPLVTVNCGAIPRELAESELFGHKKGAFTSASQDHVGYFEQADTGTLFLDEIGELSPELQVKLLRVLESKRFRPVGATAERKVDVRVIAATNRDLELEVRAGRFRHDLFYRLGPCLKVPALREHAEDVPELAEHFLAGLQREYRRRVRLSPGALRSLQAYAWPGNVRQLRTVLETAVATARGDVLQEADLHLPGGGAPPAEQLPTLNLAELETRAIREALGRTGGVRTQAAKLLGIHRETLINKIEKYAIEEQGRGGE